MSLHPVSSFSKPADTVSETVESSDILSQGTSPAAVDDDQMRLAKLGYKQEFRRIFSTFTNYGLTASMISVLLGVIPLYSYQLSTGGPVVFFWSWVVVGLFSINLVSCLAEICSTFPTMGALYYWAYRLGGPKYGPFASWIAGWTNLLGQIAGVSSGAYAGAQVIAQMIYLSTGIIITNNQLLGFVVVMLCVAGMVNSFAETLLTSLCYVSLTWQICGVLFIVITMLACAPKLQTVSYILTSESYNNESGFDSAAYVSLIGALAAASVFTGYDTGAHVGKTHVYIYLCAYISYMLCLYPYIILLYTSICLLSCEYG